MNRADIIKAVVEGTLLLKSSPMVVEFVQTGTSLWQDEPQDVDFLVLLDSGSKDFWNAARWGFEGFQLCNGEYDDQDEQWLAVRKGHVNLIITKDRDWYNRAALATDVVHLLQLDGKEDRVAAFRLIRDGMEVDEARASAKASLARQA